MSQVDEDDPKSKENWTEHDLKEAIRRINAGEINFKEAENVYGISPRTIHRQRAIENMRAQLNPEKAKKLKASNSAPPKKDVTVLRKPVDISCNTLTDVVSLLSTATEEVKQLLNYECELIYECKVCKNLFRSLANFISHKRIYCCELYSVIHARTDENDDESEIAVNERLKEKENIREFTAKPFRVTCRKDLTTVLKRITTMAEMLPSEPILHLQTIENTSSAFQQVLFSNGNDAVMPFKPVEVVDNEPKEKDVVVPVTAPVPASTSAPVPASLTTTTATTNTTAAAATTTTTATVTTATVQVEKLKPLLPQSAVPTEKNLEKTSTATEKHFIAEKRFRCPVCLANFTLKRSTLRHLKSVHHKSVEQVEKLKSRIQVHFVRIKNSSNSNDSSNKDKQGDPNHLKNAIWSKECQSCHRTFVNKQVYTTHLKSCWRNSARNIETSSDNSPPKSIPLVPVVSLTPITTSSCSSKSESSEDCLDASPTPKKTSSSKKVSLPLASSSSMSKKIGIQVRMNYCKDTPSAPNSANVTPTSYATSSVTSQSSEEDSRRNSILSIIGCAEDLPPKVEEPSKVCHNTRSGSKLAHILESLYDKKNKSLENSAPVNKIKPDKVTIYCNSCRKVFPISEFNCDVSQDNSRRYFKCALRDCNFQSDTVDQLIPHLSSSHSVLTETELANAKSNFLAVFCDENGLDSLGDCKRRPMFYEKSTTSQAAEDSKTKKKISIVAKPKSSHEAATSSTEAATNVAQSSSNKRKFPSSAPKPNSAKRKQNEKDGTKINLENIEDIPIKPDIKEETNKVIQRATAENARIESTQITVKRIKKVKKDNQTPPTRPKTAKLEPKIPNGDIASTTLSSSEDEENDDTKTVPKIKPNHSKSIINQNITSIDQKLWNSPQRMNLNKFHSELSPSSSAPDSDIDQSAMSDEHLRKSIMTIIFGNDMTAEKVEQSISTRDKSPSSSSSSECDKEKRFSFRIAKKCSQKTPVTIENKEDKALKPSCLNKSKPSSR